MKKELLIVFGLVLMISLASADIVIIQPPQSTYNIGDNLDLSMKIVATQQLNDILKVDMICGSTTTEVYKEFISMASGEKFRDLSIPLTKDFIGNSLGNCKIQYSFGKDQQSIPQQFKISNLVNILLSDYSARQVSPGEKLVISGNAVKENGQPITGTIEAYFYSSETRSLTFTNIVNNGTFNLEITPSSNAKAGDYNLVLHAYESNKGIIINQGAQNMGLTIKQVPTNLEIKLDSTQLKPAQTVRGKIILHDQSGKEISTDAYVAIKNQNNEIVQKIVTTTGNYFEYIINQSEAPNSWKISAIASDIKNDVSFTILTDKEIKTDIINNTIIVTNTGNVLYEDQVNVTIGNYAKTVYVMLGIGQSKKFYLTAPTGKYMVSSGNVVKEVSLTGRAMNVKQMPDKKFLMSPIVWIFIIIILLLLFIFIFIRVRKKPYHGRKTEYKTIKGGNINRLSKEVVVLEAKPAKSAMIETRNTAQIETSIHGTKQNATVVLVHMKNYEQFSSGSGNTKETMQKIVDFAENNKAIIYENRGNIFFILAPSKTRTFDNEMLAIKIAQEANLLLTGHNKVFKQKILYGIGIDNGEIVLNSDKGYQFMPIGSFMTNLKRTAHLANNEISLGDKVKNKTATNIISEKRDSSGYSTNILKGVTKRGEHSTFIRGFMDRMERDKARPQQQSSPKEQSQSNSSDDDSDIFIR